MTTSERAEYEIHQAWKLLRKDPQDWVRLAQIAEFTDIAPADWTDTLASMLRNDSTVQLAPESNTKVLTDEDRAAAVRIGSEDLHLITFESGYVAPKR